MKYGLQLLMSYDAWITCRTWWATKEEAIREAKQSNFLHKSRFPARVIDKDGNVVWEEEENSEI